MNDQEVINNYLVNNPLKGKQRKQDKVYTRPCVSCGAKVFPTKKRPATPYNGSLLDKFKDHIEDFPLDEDEDLCGTCKTVIRNTNIDMNADISEKDWCMSWTDSLKAENDVDFNNEFLVSEKDYQGYTNTDSMEGLYEQYEMNGEKPLKFDK